jgi:hypothetical protein
MIGLSGMSSSLGGLGPDIELQTLGAGFDNQPAGQVFDALIGVPRPFNLLQGLRNLIAPVVLETGRTFFGRSPRRDKSYR